MIVHVSTPSPPGLRAFRSAVVIGYTAGHQKIKKRFVDYCHQHNLVDPHTAGAERRFGIRVTLPANDTLRKLLGDNWERLHWFATRRERDAALDGMAIRHGYYRNSDSPTQVLEKIDR